LIDDFLSEGALYLLQWCIPGQLEQLPLGDIGQLSLSGQVRHTDGAAVAIGLACIGVFKHGYVEQVDKEAGQWNHENEDPKARFVRGNGMMYKKHLDKDFYHQQNVH
jgi:hypothetical protein